MTLLVTGEVPSTARSGDLMTALSLLIEYGFFAAPTPMDRRTRMANR